MAELRRCKGTWAFCDGYCEKCNTTATTQTSMMYLIPSNTDVVKVVRCKDCIHAKKSYIQLFKQFGGEDRWTCDHLKAFVRADFYCADGKRKEK